jgi:hypothetical protein
MDILRERGQLVAPRVARCLHPFPPGTREAQRDDPTIRTRTALHPALGLEARDQPHGSGVRQAHDIGEEVDRAIRPRFDREKRRRDGSSRPDRAFQFPREGVALIGHEGAEQVEQVFGRPCAAGAGN